MIWHQKIEIVDMLWSVKLERLKSLQAIWSNKRLVTRLVVLLRVVWFVVGTNEFSICLSSAGCAERKQLGRLSQIF